MAKWWIFSVISFVLALVVFYIVKKIDCFERPILSKVLEITCYALFVLGGLLSIIYSIVVYVKTGIVL